MKVLEWLMAFVVKNDVAVMIGAFVLLIVWDIGNILPNIYRKQIAAMEKCRRLIIADSDKTALHVRFLPDEYRRQWRAFVRTKAEKPSLAFEFVRLHRRWQLWGLFGLAVFCSAFLFGLYVPEESNESYVVFQIAFGNAVALSFVIICAINAKRERFARFAFGRLVAELNKHLDLQSAEKQDFEDTVRRINDLNRMPVTQNTLGRAAEILKTKGLDENRTASQQRKLNLALNSLLQAYARTKNRENGTKA